MGKTRNSGLGFGTESLSQGNLKQSSADAKIEKLIKEIKLGHENTRAESLSLLEEAGVKYNPEEVVFVTKDKTGQLIWLEKGSDNAGLNHILKRHADDFSSKHNISKENISYHVLNLITNGKVEYARIVKKGNREGLEKLYSHNGDYFLLSGIGTNGFIISAYPISQKEAKKLIERYKKDGTKNN